MKKFFLKIKKDDGFTLIEILITLTIFLIISVTIYSAFLLSQRASQEVQSSIEMSQNGRVIIERIIREIRQAREVIGDFPVERENAVNEIIFEDGHIAEPYHYIHYFQEGNEVKKEVIGYYFSGDPEENLQPWNARPPDGQTLVKKIIQPALVIGELVDQLQFWGSGALVHIGLVLKKQDKTFELETSIFGRNF